MSNYIRRFWKARAGTNLNKFTKSSETASSVILENAPDAITEAGTPFTADAENMTRMIAGLRAEYRAEEWQGQYLGWVPTSPWTAEKPVGSTDPHTRIVPRYVTEQEVCE